MTVSTEVNHNEYTGNGVTTTFPYAFRIFQASDLLVTTSDTNGTLRTLTLNTDYTVSGVGSYSGGTVILPVPLGNGWSISIERDLPVVQETDLRNQGRFFAETHEGAFDYLTMLIQQCFGWARLALLKPNFLAKYYDAKQNRIANLADPVAAQDAVNNRSMRTYVDRAIAGVVGGYGWFIQVGLGGVYRTFQDKMSDDISLKDFGASPDDKSKNDSAIDYSKNLGGVSVPKGIFKSSKNPASMGGPYLGPGQIFGADNNKRGKVFTSVDSEPASLGSNNSVVTAFNGDLSKSPFQVEHRIYGENTLGKPKSGYDYRSEVMPFFGYLYNESGWNEGLDGNSGRTGVAFFRAMIFQKGQGDSACFNGSVFVTGTKPGSTHFLANPAGSLFNGDMTAGENGIYLNPYETIMSDNGFDVACVGAVYNMNRSNGDGAKSAVWMGVRLASVGSAPCDAMISGIGQWKSGIDFSMSTLYFGAKQAAISLKAGQRIYFNNAANAAGNTEKDWFTTVFNDDFISYEGDKIVVAAGGNPNLQVSKSAVTAIPQLNMESSFNVLGKNTSLTVGAAGPASALPTKPSIYLTAKVDGVAYKIPLYANS